MKPIKHFLSDLKFFVAPIIVIILLSIAFVKIGIHIHTVQRNFPQQQISLNNNQKLIQKDTVRVNLSKWKATRKKIFLQIISIFLIAMAGVLIFLYFLFKLKKKLMADNKYILKCLRNENNLGKNIDLSKLHFTEFKTIAEHFNTLYNKNSISYIQLIKSQRNLENILNTMSDGIFIHDENGTIIEVNNSTLKMYGLKNKQDLKIYSTLKSLSSVKNDLSKIYEYCSIAIQGKSIQFEWIGRNIKKNIDFPILVNLTKIIYKNKHVLLASVRDISKLIKARKKLKDKNQLYQTTLENISDCVIRTNLNFEIEFINKATERLINKPLEKVKGKRIDLTLKIIDANTHQSVSQDLEKLVGLGKNCKKMDLVVVDWKGKEINADISFTVIYDSNKIAYSILFVIKDVTEKVNYLAEISKNRNLESLGLLAGGIAHGFNNILTGVFGNISLARYYLNGSNNKAENYLTLAENAMTKAKYLSAELLTFAEGDKNTIETININNLILQIVNNLTNHFSTEIIYYKNPNLWTISADKDQIEQAIVNVIENACESMNNKGKVKIKTANYDNSHNAEPKLDPIQYIKIEVEDRGKGIKESHIPKIFDPYFTTKFLGRGLGLSIAFSVVTKHSGKIFVNSKELFGTKITIYLPTSKISKEKIQKEINRISQHNILLLDEYESILKINKEIFEDAGYNLIVAETPEELIHLYELRTEIIDKFDVIIIGLKIAKEIEITDIINKVRNLNEDVKILLTAAEYNAEEVKRYKKNGVHEIIFDSYSTEKIIEIINRQTIKENLEMGKVKVFKTCSFCGKKWKTREEFLSDKKVKLVGYQINYIDIEKGLFLFNHSCNTTIAIEVEEFMDLYKGVKYTENKLNTDECPGYCLDEKELQDCGNTCYYNQVRKLMLVILDYNKKDSQENNQKGKIL